MVLGVRILPVVAEPVYLDPSTVRVTLAEGASAPDVHVAAVVYPRSDIRRLLPLSQASSYLAIVEAEGREVGILRNLEGMDSTSVETIRSLLDRRYFTPIVSRIRKLVQEGGMWRFEVETQRGPVEFFVRNWRDSAHEIGPGRWLVSSVDGQRFEIPGGNALDSRSQILMEQLL